MSKRMDGIYQRYGKPLFDRTVAFAAIVLLAPVIAFLAVMVRVRLGGPVLFVQERPGRFGCPFRLLKFRTMTDGRDSQGRLLPDHERMTPFGDWLRATSLDELPELWNILRGEMSFVGPRPLLMDYLRKYSPSQMRRHDVLPGLTGWAQVNGRNLTAWDERFRQDVWYVDHVCPRLDFLILKATVKQVWSRRGVSAEGHVTMPRFDQSPSAGWEHGKAS